MKLLADHMAGMVAQARGPVEVFTPLHGFSNHDSPHGHIEDRSVPGPFAEYLRSVIPASVPVTAVDAHFNDEAFSDAVTAAARRLLAAR